MAGHDAHEGIAAFVEKRAAGVPRRVTHGDGRRRRYLSGSASTGSARRAASRRPDLELLADLQVAHLLTVPFENLDVYHRRGVATDLAWSLPKIVEAPARRMVLRAQRRLRMAAARARLRRSTTCRAGCSAPMGGGRRSTTARSSSTSTASAGWSTSGSVTAAWCRCGSIDGEHDGRAAPRAVRASTATRSACPSWHSTARGATACRAASSPPARRLHAAQRLPADRARIGVDAEAVRHARPRPPTAHASRCATACSGSVAGVGCVVDTQVARRGSWSALSRATLRAPPRTARNQPLGVEAGRGSWL